MAPSLIIEFRPPIAELAARIMSDIHAGMKAGLVGTLQKGRAILIEEEPYVTHNMQLSTRSYVLGDVDGVIKVQADYAQYVNDGTGIYHEPEPREPWTIRARNMQALYWPGARYPVKAVHREGNRPNPFVNRMLERWDAQYWFAHYFSERMEDAGD